MDLSPFTNLGEVAIIAAALLGVVYVMRPGLAALVGAMKEVSNVNRELLKQMETFNAAQDRATAQAAKVETALVNVSTKQEAHTDVLVQLVKTLPDTVAQIVRATESAATRTIEAVNANTDKHDAEYKAALDEVKSIIGELRTEIAEGHKALRGDVLGRLDKVISLLTPPTPPQLVKHPEPLEQREAA